MIELGRANAVFGPFMVAPMFDWKESPRQLRKPEKTVSYHAAPNEFENE